jgi:hypothetical protein
MITAELFKIRTLRAPWVIGAVLLAVAGAGLAFNAALLGDPGQPTFTPAVLGDLVRMPGRLAGGAALLLGVVLTTSEYRHRTVLTTRLAQPRPGRTVAAKALAAAIAGAVVAAAVELALLAGAGVLFAVRDVAFEPLAHGVPAAVVRILVVAALHAAAGVGIGELLRNPALAVGAVLGWVFLVEGVVPVLLREPDAARWLPGGAATGALSADPWGGAALAAGLAPAVALAVLAGYAAVLLTAGLSRARASDP